MRVGPADRRSGLLGLLLAAVIGCATEEAEIALDSPPAELAPISDAMDVALYRPALCDRPGDDRVRDVFCAEARPRIQSLLELEASLNFSDAAPITLSRPGFASTVVALGHSTALSGRLVSPINPRLIMISQEARAPSFLAFSRGVQQVEIIASDRALERFNFYLLRFEQACNLTPAACSAGDLYTPRIESDWQRIALQDDEDLENTPADCRQCHQRGRAAPIPLMRELRGPWTHFFAPPDQGPLPFPEAIGSDLSRDYMSAKGDEAYGGVPADGLVNSVGVTLENSVPLDQPLLFEGGTILNERWPWSPDGYAPAAQPSALWYDAFAAFKLGELQALPYPGGRATDLAKQEALSDAYRRVRAGTLSPDALPDLAEIFPDDPQVRAEIGLVTEPGAAPAQLLVQACGSCHNDVLDQSLSRARFNIALGRIEPAERAVAIARLALPRGAAGAMPPADARQLDAAGLRALQQYLRQDVRAAEDDALLDYAAQRGMAGPQRRMRSLRDPVD
jgi:mono/diheme cytochrome c family protein